MWWHRHIKVATYTPYIPSAFAASSTGETSALTQSLISLVGSLGVFAFIGFHVLATTAEETRNPAHRLAGRGHGAVRGGRPWCSPADGQLHQLAHPARTARTPP